MIDRLQAWTMTGLLSLCLGALLAVFHEVRAAPQVVHSLAWEQAAPPLVAAADDQPAADNRRAILEQKLRLLSTYLESPALSGVSKGGSQEAHALLRSAETLRERAEAQMTAGNLEASEGALDKALKLIFSAKVLVRGTSVRPDIDRSKARFARMSREIESYLRSLRQALKDEASDDDIVAGLEQVEGLVADAKSIAVDGKSEAAVERLTEAYQAAVQLVVRLRGGQTVAYRLSFANPEEELEYERRRNGSYLMLVKLVLQENETISSGLTSLVGRQLEESRLVRLQSDQEAAQGRHSEAIAFMEESTGLLVRALQAFGLPISE